jgi:hypothetical protein
MQKSFIVLLILSTSLVAVPVTAIFLTETTSVLAQSRPARNTKVLLRKVAAAQRTLEANNFEKFLYELKRIDATRTPSPIQQSFSNYVLAIEAAVSTNQSGLTNEALLMLQSAEMEFRKVADRQLRRKS